MAAFLLGRVALGQIGIGLPKGAAWVEALLVGVGGNSIPEVDVFVGGLTNGSLLQIRGLNVSGLKIWRLRRVLKNKKLGDPWRVSPQPCSNQVRGCGLGVSMGGCHGVGGVTFGRCEGGMGRGNIEALCRTR